MGAPMLVGIMTIPYLIRSLGTDRFGVLTLAWSLIGYFSLFDFGLGRTLTQAVAERLGTGREQDVPVVLWTALTLMIVLGLVGLLAGAMLTPWIVRRVLRIPTSLEAETITAFLILALSVPATITTTGLRGALEAYHRFGVTSGLRAAMGIFTFLAPVLVIPFSRSLVCHRRRVACGASSRPGRPRRGLPRLHDRGGSTGHQRDGGPRPHRATSPGRGLDDGVEPDQPPDGHDGPLPDRLHGIAHRGGLLRHPIRRRDPSTDHPDRSGDGGVSGVRRHVQARQGPFRAPVQPGGVVPASGPAPHRRRRHPVRETWTRALARR